MVIYNITVLDVMTALGFVSKVGFDCPSRQC